MSALTTVTLDELNHEAELQTRTDRKYIVSAEVLGELVDNSGVALAALEIEGQRSFAYESVYFDTPDYALYRAAAHRRRRRYKVRTRTYLDSGVSMLEVKSKGRRKATIKHRQSHSFDERRCLDANAERFVDVLLGAGGTAQTLVPVLTTEYRRRTFLAADDRARVTVDVGLRAIDERGGCVLLGDAAIVETKTSGAGCVVDQWLWNRGLRPQTISKFGTSLGALRPDLPSNKWHRVIQQNLVVASSVPSNGAI